MRYLILIPLLFTTGCEALLANVITDYQDTRNLTRNYIGENVTDRQSVRMGCRNIVTVQVQELVAEGKYEEAKTMLRNSYAPVITFKMIKNGDPVVIAEEVNTPHICGKGE